MPRRVVIIGGGFAGLSAGVELSERGFEVLLLERRRHLGGRAYSFTDTRTGDPVDNGQHLFMGCYTHTIAFLKKIGCLEKLKFQEQTHIDFLDAGRRPDSFDCPPLPAPFHVLAGLFLLKGLTLGDKLRTLHMARALRDRAAENAALSVSKWLKKYHQSERINERFWHPMTIATLNESPEVASSKMMRVVLQEAFGKGREASALGIASVGLSDLYTDSAQQFIEARGGRIRFLSHVARFRIAGGRVVAVELKTGETIETDHLISSVPPAVLWQLLDDDLRTGELKSVEKLTSSPIISINLWFDRPLVDKPFIGLLGTRLQWLFNKEVILRTANGSHQLALIISAAHAYTDWTKNQLVDMAVGELHQLLPESRDAELVHSAVVKERDATLSHTVASDTLRPGAKTSIPNLVLAGDWTDTGLPATIESALLSGKRAAELVRVGA